MFVIDALVKPGWLSDVEDGRHFLSYFFCEKVLTARKWVFRNMFVLWSVYTVAHCSPTEQRLSKHSSKSVTFVGNKTGSDTVNGDSATAIEIEGKEQDAKKQEAPKIVNLKESWSSSIYLPYLFD